MRERFNDLADQANEGYDSARIGVRSAYNSAREYPGTIAAIIVGIGVTGFLLWAARRSGGWRNLQTEAMDRVRQGYDYARDGYGRAREVVKDGASRLRRESDQLT